MKELVLHKENLPYVLNPKEVASILGISLPFCYELFRSEDFPAFRISKRWVVQRDSFFEWINTQSKKDKSCFIKRVKL